MMSKGLGVALVVVMLAAPAWGDSTTWGSDGKEIPPRRAICQELERLYTQEKERAQSPARRFFDTVGGRDPDAQTLDLLDRMERAGCSR